MEGAEWEIVLGRNVNVKSGVKKWKEKDKGGVTERQREMAVLLSVHTNQSDSLHVFTCFHLHPFPS